MRLLRNSEQGLRNPNRRREPSLPCPGPLVCHSERQSRNPNRRGEPLLPFPDPLPCHSERQPRNPNRRGEPLVTFPFPVPPSLSFRAAVEESKSHSARGLPLGMTLAPHRWDSSAAARNDRVRCLGVGLLVETVGGARNDRPGPWYDGSLPTFWIPRKGSEWQGMGMQHSLQATAIPQTTVMSSIEKKGLSQSGSGSPVRRRV